MITKKFSKQELTIIHQILQTAYKNDFKIHLILNGGSVRNGYIKDLKPDFCIFEDEKNGLEVIFYLLIAKVENYRPKKT